MENVNIALTDETRQIVASYLNRTKRRRESRRALSTVSQLKYMLSDMRLNPDKYSHKPATFTRLSIELERSLLK